MKKFLKRLTAARVAYASWSSLKQEHCFGWPRGIWRLYHYFREYTAFRNQGPNPHFTDSWRDVYPCLADKTQNTPIEPTYFFQNAWAASKIFNLKPDAHYDVGSSLAWLGIIAQHTPTTTVDIRTAKVDIEGLTFKQGSVLALPFPDRSIASLSSLCVVEHIGLGRYGDQMDPWGSEKAIAELKRVLRPGGNLLFSVPIDEECRVYFNAHRSFTREYLLSLMNGMRLIEERYIYGYVLHREYDKKKGFGTGLYHFVAH
jgi:SAM-dependent methyltransferase